jgi:hypothetical protein
MVVLDGCLVVHKLVPRVALVPCDAHFETGVLGNAIVFLDFSTLVLGN